MGSRRKNKEKYKAKQGARKRLQGQHGKLKEVQRNHKGEEKECLGIGKASKANTKDREGEHKKYKVSSEALRGRMKQWK